jgi:hypothetical protein
VGQRCSAGQEQCSRLFLRNVEHLRSSLNRSHHACSAWSGKRACWSSGTKIEGLRAEGSNIEGTSSHEPFILQALPLKVCAQAQASLSRARFWQGPKAVALVGFRAVRLPDVLRVSRGEAGRALLELRAAHRRGAGVRTWHPTSWPRTRKARANSTRVPRALLPGSLVKGCGTCGFLRKPRRCHRA